MKSISWKNGIIIAVDQMKLPWKLTYLKLKGTSEIAAAIKRLSIRGAPLLGAAAALSLAQTAYFSKAKNRIALLKELEKASNIIKSTRPTAVNLFNSLDFILEESRKHQGNVESLKNFAIQLGLKIVRKDAEVNRNVSLNGAQLIRSGETILTHCNSGELATVQYGTGLGVIIMAHRQGKKIKAIATETRPLLQGARLTAFELKRAKIPFMLITDNMVGYVMSKRMVDKVVVGADRILTSGHVINKIGTYTIAVLAKQHGIPFYVAAPTSTLDSESSIEQVKIEERDPLEVLECYGKPITLKNVKAFNPAFDITPPEFVSGIITEKGVFQPNSEEFKKLCCTLI